MKITPEMRKRLQRAGISPDAFHTRIRRGWTLDAALDTPSEKQGKEYYVVKNGKLLCTKKGASEVAKFITEKAKRYETATDIITKNMVIGQIYRKGYALFEINGNKYAVGLAEETTGEYINDIEIR